MSKSKVIQQKKKSFINTSSIVDCKNLGERTFICVGCGENCLLCGKEIRIIPVEALIVKLQNQNRDDETKLRSIHFPIVYIISSEKLEGRIEGRNEALELLGIKETKK